jgi:hypothetical protein
VGLKMFPYRVACFVPAAGAPRPFYGARDPPHILKSAAGQMRSCARRLLIGDFFVETVGLLRNGLPISAYTGKFSQSDKHAQMIFAAVLYTSMTWMGYGTLVFALLVETLMQAWWDVHADKCHSIMLLDLKQESLGYLTADGTAAISRVVQNCFDCYFEVAVETSKEDLSRSPPTLVLTLKSGARDALTALPEMEMPPLRKQVRRAGPAASTSASVKAATGSSEAVPASGAPVSNQRYNPTLAHQPVPACPKQQAKGPETKRKRSDPP